MLKKILLVLFSIIMVFTISGCNGKKSSSDSDSDDSGNSNLPPQKQLLNITSYDMDAYVQPFWYSREMYNETCMFIGANSQCTLLYKPVSDILVRNYQLNVTYKEGVDYSIDGKIIKRLENSAMPYFEYDDYFMLQPDATISLPVNKSELEVDLSGERFLKFGEGDTFTKKQIAITYRYDDVFSGEIPAPKNNILQNFVTKLQEEKKGSIMFYGDSITFGCNASGTPEGGNISPFTPRWSNIVTDYLKKFYGAEIDYRNGSVGGWSSKNGVDNFATKVKSIAKNIDLLVLAFGMNDGKMPVSEYKSNISSMVNSYLTANPNGNVVLVSTMLPNKQSTWRENQQLFQDSLIELEKEYSNVAVAKITTMFNAIESNGKLSRDYLSNNVNHPNDFGVRVYAQVILKTIIGEGFDK